MPQLIASDRVQKEYQDFKIKIDAIQDQQTQEQLTEWLNSLMSEIKELDFHTNTVQPGMPLSPMANGIRNKISELRKKIVKALEQQGF